jgi:hypothetical protein
MNNKTQINCHGLHYLGICLDRWWKTGQNCLRPNPNSKHVRAEQNSEVSSLEPVCSVCISRNRLQNN